MWSEKLNNGKSDGGKVGDVSYRVCAIDRSIVVLRKTSEKSNSLKSKKEYIQVMINIIISFVSRWI